MPASEHERRLLLLDMGGVFFDYAFDRALAHWAAAAGTDIARLSEAWGIDDAFDSFERGEITGADYLAHLRRRLGLELDDQQMTDGWNAIYGPVNRDLVDLLATPEIRHRFHTVLGVSNTNALHAGAWRQLYRADLPVLDGTVCSHEIGTTKPRPEFFERIAADHKVPLTAMVLVDDIPVVTQDAAALGLRTHTYTGADNLARFLTRQ
ncbi:hypothetical protein AB0K57_29800 [Streptomyces halstedii]|uniref:hypothetical protein n=1 Tax=Streptomyces halstedii TaxID=1944 RepID=UPI003460C2B5